MIQTLLDRIQGKAPKGAKRSPKWRKVRKAYLSKNPRCFSCKGTKKLEAHHIKPFHLFPELELEESNLMPLCRRGKYGVTCHQLVGHRGDYRKFNDEALRDAGRIAELLGRY